MTDDWFSALSASLPGTQLDVEQLRPTPAGVLRAVSALVDGEVEVLDL